MTKQAFALRKSVKDFAGGSVAVGADGRTLDLAARMHKGVITTSDPDEIRALEGVAILEKKEG